MNKMQKDFSRNLAGRKKDTEIDVENLTPQLNLW